MSDDIEESAPALDQPWKYHNGISPFIHALEGAPFLKGSFFCFDFGTYCLIIAFTIYMLVLGEDGFL
jgi:hypothetical protein